MKMILTICLVFCLSACTSTTQDLSTGQRYYAAKQDLESLLSAATQYKIICFERDPNDSCYGQVKEIQKIKPEIISAFEVAESYRIQNNDSMLLASTTAISKIAVELSSYLIQLKMEVESGS